MPTYGEKPINSAGSFANTRMEVPVTFPTKTVNPAPPKEMTIPKNMAFHIFDN
jgi:hypothetical protein